MSKRFRSASAVLRVSILALVAMLTFAAVANAAFFRGNTQQGKNAKLQVANGSGLPTKFVIGWETKRCRGKGTTYRDKTTFSGFKQASRNSLSTRGSYTTRQGDGIRSKVRVVLDGRKRGAKRWKGDFSARVRILRNGNQIDKCRLADNDWTVRRGGSKASASFPSAASRGWSR